MECTKAYLNNSQYLPHTKSSRELMEATHLRLSIYHRRAFFQGHILQVVYWISNQEQLPPLW